MTTPTRDQAPLPERDPAFDAAWRAASDEMPPAALDAAILAAAHRAVGAGPRRADVREATRPERWWWPLAAAATIGAFTIGILQLMPADRGALSDDRAVVSDMPVGPTTAKSPVAAKPAAEAVAPESPPAPPPVAPSAPAPIAPPAGSSMTPPAAPPAAERRSVARDEPQARERAVAKREANSAAPAPVPFPAPASEPVPQPPQVASPPEASSAPAPAKSTAPATAGMSAPAPAPRPAPATAPSPALAAAPDTKAQADAAAPQQLAQPFPGSPAAQRQAAGGGATPSAAMGKLAAEAEPAARSDLRKQAKAPLAVNEWIALIRKLRHDGMVREAEKELAAFRAAHPDHERLLPPDLREWRPAGK